MTKHHIPILVLIVALLASCSSLGTSPTLSRPSAVPSALTSPSANLSPTALVIPTRYPTPTATLAPVASTATSAIALSPEGVLTYQPLEVVPDVSIHVIPTGTLILSGQHSYRLNFEQHAQKEISGSITFLGTSPNGKWLAYYQRVSDPIPWLIVETIDGQQVKRLPMGEDWVSYTESSAWLDNERLVFNLWKDQAHSHAPGVYPVVVVNPFTGGQQELLSDYPDLRATVGGPAGTLHFVYSTVVYNLSLNFVIYPQTTQEGTYIVLWDRQTKKALAVCRRSHWLCVSGQ